MTDPTPHQITEECANDASRVRLNRAKAAAHEAYLAANLAISLLDETADPTWITDAQATREHAWKLWQALVLETEW